MPSEVEAGLDKLRKIIAATNLLELRQIQQSGQLGPFVIVVGVQKRQASLRLSWEFLCDLPNTREYQLASETYFQFLAKRIQFASAYEFYCKCRIPVRLELSWPLGRVQDRDATYLHVNVYSLRETSLVAKCSVIITGQQEVFDIQRNPFHREEAVIQTIRQAVDSGEVKFFKKGAHPDLLQEIQLEIKPRDSVRATENELEAFLAGKVYWLAFKQHNASAKVWISDPWDAAYLGVEPKSLTQAAQILAARKVIVLDSTQEFASVGDVLLQQADPFEAAPAQQRELETGFPRRNDGVPQWDAFICHASEDKEGFVRPLAESLKQTGLKIWYDEFTLRIGDSLRRSIDRGLKYSRFGVVVLSPAFFAKHWPQVELDGLAQKEVQGKKVILPVWHNVTVDDVRSYSPSLADRFAVSSSEGVEVVVQKLAGAIRAGDTKL